MVASVGSAARDAVMFALLLAFLALGDSAGKPPFLDALKAGVIIGEFGVKIVHRIAEMLRDCLSAIHAYSIPFVLLVVKG
jgi:hypothetical protein